MTSFAERTGLASIKRFVSLRLRGDIERRFRGRFPSHAAALGAVRPKNLAGYDHAEVAEIAFQQMCEVTLWDYPVLFWLQRLLPCGGVLLDAAGHMGTKYRAFRDLLDLPHGFDWAVYDVPAIVKAGRERASADGLATLSFHDTLERVPAAEIMLGSGLLQYLDQPLSTFMRRLPQLPRHLVLNKVALREGDTVVTLEQFPGAEIPYVVLGRVSFEAELDELGYEIVDQWEIDALCYRHRAFGQSISRGYYARLKAG